MGTRKKRTSQANLIKFIHDKEDNIFCAIGFFYLNLLFLYSSNLNYFF